MGLDLSSPQENHQDNLEWYKSTPFYDKLNKKNLYYGFSLFILTFLFNSYKYFANLKLYAKCHPLYTNSILTTIHYSLTTS